MENLKPLEKDFVEFHVKMGRAYGMSDLLMTIFGLLYIEPGDMAMEDIAKKTGYSLATISHATKTLETAGVILRKSKPGTRKVFFYMDKNLLRMNIAKLRSIQQTQIKPAKLFIPAMIEKYKNKARDADSKEKLKLIESYLNQMLEFEKLLQDWIRDLEKLSVKY